MCKNPLPYVLIEEFYLKLHKTVITLLQPFKGPGSDDLLNPSLYVTVPETYTVSPL